MEQGLIAIFDIGKTNKKFFLFDESMDEIHHEYEHFREIEDEDGDPCEDLSKLTYWMQETLFQALQQYPIRALNISTYGASLIHLDQQGKPLTPLYNYTKDFPEVLKKQFFHQFGPEPTWSRQTASPSLGMLNSGLQLYWLKYQRPEVFSHVYRSLHFPQYCSFLFSGEMRSEYTSLGCHTGLWDYEAGDYHAWVKQEGLLGLMAPLHATYESEFYELWGQRVKVGTGIHDSSAALLPYLQSSDEPFLLLSTGTWSIALNPFNQVHLTDEELAQDCLNFMGPQGQPVRASRLFLGQEHKLQLQKLNTHFHVDKHHYHQVPFDSHWIGRGGERVFQFEELAHGAEVQGDLNQFPHFEAAYHRLVEELMVLQIQAIRLALGQSKVRRIYLDGGFSGNDIFISLLKRAFPDFELFLSQKPLGSAIGAALALEPQKALSLNQSKG